MYITHFLKSNASPLPFPKLLSDLAFDDLLWMSGEFRNQINVIKGLFFKNSFMKFNNLQNIIFRQLSRGIKSQNLGEDTMQDQNKIDNVGRQKFCR